MTTNKTTRRLAVTVILIFLPIVFGFVLWTRSRAVAVSSSQYTTTPRPSSIQKTDDTVSWKTYTNSRLGVEFRYPESYRIIEDSKSNRVSLLRNAGYGNILEVSRIDTLDSIETWWSSNSNSYVPHVMTKAQFSGYPAYLFTNTSKDVQVPMNWYMVQRQGYLLQISFSTPFDLNLYPAQERTSYENYNDKFGNILKQSIDTILSTFRFTE